MSGVRRPTAVQQCTAASREGAGARSDRGRHTITPQEEVRMRRITPGFSLLLAGAMVLAACSDVREPTSPGARVADPAGATSTDPLMDAVARAVPEFGGLFIDADGVPTVYLTDERKRGAVEKELGGFLAERGFAPSEMRVRRAKFAYADLNDWFRHASPEVLETSGVVFVDLD